MRVSAIPKEMCAITYKSGARRVYRTARGGSVVQLYEKRQDAEQGLRHSKWLREVKMVRVGLVLLDESEAW